MNAASPEIHQSSLFSIYPKGTISMNENISSIDSSYWLSSTVATNDDVHHHQDLFFPDISDDELNPLMPQWSYQLASVYLSFVTFVGLTLNGAIIIAILRDPQQRTPLNWMLLNLAFSDGIISSFGTPISAVAAAKGGWHLSHEMCVTYAMVMSITGIASITILCVLALWRCTLVVFSPVKRHLAGTRGQVGSRQAFLLSLLIWSYAGAVTAPPLLGWGRYDLEAAHISCSVNWESRMDNNRSYIIYLFSLGLIVPLAIIIASYLSIIHVVRKTKKMKRKLIRQHFSSSTPPLHVSTTEGAEKRITMMVACMVGTFIVSWTPYSILALMETFGSFNISPAVATIPSLFAKTSVVFNPLVYGLLNTQFRSAFSSSFRLPFRSKSNNSSPSNYNGNGIPGVNEEDCDRPVVIGNNNTTRPSPTIQMEMNTIPSAVPNNDEDEERIKETLIFIREKTTMSCIVDKKNTEAVMTGPSIQSRHHPVIVNMDSSFDDPGYTSNSTCNNQAPVIILNNHCVLMVTSCQDDDDGEAGDVVDSKTDTIEPHDDVGLGNNTNTSCCDGSAYSASE